MMCRSVPQMPQALTATSTEPGGRSGSGTSAICSRSAGSSRRTAAFTSPAPSAA